LRSRLGECLAAPCFLGTDRR